MEFVNGSAFNNVDEICWLFYCSKRLKVAINFMCHILSKNFSQKIIKFG